jgi:hypothetical protein
MLIEFYFDIKILFACWDSNTIYIFFYKMAVYLFFTKWRFFCFFLQNWRFISKYISWKSSGCPQINVEIVGTDTP